ncbi:PLP-dependent aminotransferase family protein [Nitrobacter sp.]|uniref:MocR-like pyridoxine biosynthesis transcription factor PdxR n=1 Tax=unclassified Nitrobacter TaxID=2620411 RepID=UPI00321F9096
MASPHHLRLELVSDGARPVFMDIAYSIIGEIERGRLKPGDRLPGTRALASSLQVHRNTVDAAYQELTMQGWLVARPARGTFVADDLPAPEKQEAPPLSRRSPIDPPRISAAPPTLRVSDGAPDARLMPAAQLARSFRASLMTPAFVGGGGYGDPRGAIRLRAALSDYLIAERGLTASANDILITRGSQMGLYLAAAALLDPGQAIAVEEPGYPLAWAAFRAAGARVLGVPVDSHGIDVDRLSALAEREPELRAVYVTPHHQYPTTVTLGASRRLKLLDLARRKRLVLIEDDYDHEYRFEGRPVLPLAARADAERVVYLGSLSKLLAPAVRVGYAIAAPAILTRMADRREAIDRQGDVPLEQALAGLIEDGELRRHTRKARRIYGERRDRFAAAIRRELGDHVDFELPAGGLALWLRLRSGLDAESWAANAARAGLVVSPGVRFALDAARAPQAFRLGYASLTETELDVVVTLMKRAIDN